MTSLLSLRDDSRGGGRGIIFPSGLSAAHPSVCLKVPCLEVCIINFFSFLSLRSPTTGENRQSTDHNKTCTAFRIHDNLSIDVLFVL